MSSASAPAKWLAGELAALLASPPGDAFGARFDKMVMRHARGLVAGREVDREGLKMSLLALQTQWDPRAEHRLEDVVLHHRIEGFHAEMGVRIEFVSAETALEQTLTCEACVAQQDGSRRIKTLLLDGDPSLFKL